MRGTPQKLKIPGLRASQSFVEFPTLRGGCYIIQEMKVHSKKVTAN